MNKAFLLPFLFIPSLVNAGPILTPCSNSWDGQGLTACELIGRPGETNTFIDLTNYTLEGTLFSLTARTNNVSLTQESDGSLTYRNEYSLFNSLFSPMQFAYWLDENDRIIVGIEDLDGTESIGSDWDYNDFIVRYIPNPVVCTINCKPTNVPEAGTTGLMLISAIFILFLINRKRNC